MTDVFSMSDSVATNTDIAFLCVCLVEKYDKDLDQYRVVGHVEVRLHIFVTPVYWLSFLEYIVGASMTFYPLNILQDI